MKRVTWKQIHDAIGKVTEAVLDPADPRIRRATIYINEATTVKATVQHRQRRNARQTTMILTVGRPNYGERYYIRRAKKNGEKFPETTPDIEFWPK